MITDSLYARATSKPITGALGIGAETIGQVNQLRQRGQQLLARGAIEGASYARKVALDRARHPLGHAGLPKPVHEVQERFRTRLEDFEDGIRQLVPELEDHNKDIELAAKLGLKWMEVAKGERRTGLNTEKTDLDYASEYPFILDQSGMRPDHSQRVLIRMHELLIASGADMESADGPPPAL